MSSVALERAQVGELLRRHPVLSSILIALFVLLAIALLWHLVAMVHGYPDGMLGGCIVVLAAALLVLAPREARTVPPHVPGPAKRLPVAAPPGPAPRPPPDRSMLEASVLLL
ncbi:MAG TPA: hypothetical protein VF029_03320 [Actinomycetota bacterium]